MGWARLVQMGALLQLRGGDGMNLYQLSVQPIRSVDGGWGGMFGGLVAVALA
jgi:hypothetical protein